SLPRTAFHHAALLQSELEMSRRLVEAGERRREHAEKVRHRAVTYVPAGDGEPVGVWAQHVVENRGARSVAERGDYFRQQSERPHPPVVARNDRETLAGQRVEQEAGLAFGSEVDICRGQHAATEWDGRMAVRHVTSGVETMRQ